MISIFAFLFVFSVVVLIHELGHFITAKMLGIKGVDSILSGRFLEPPLYEGIPLTKKISHSDIQHFFKETARTLIRNHIGNEI